MNPLVSPLAWTTVGLEARPASDAIDRLPVLVIFPHNQCNCRCAMCDIWRIRQAQEITPQDLAEQQASIRGLGVRWVVFSGGEPQMNRQWYGLAQMLRSAGIRVTLLTAGLLLEAEAERVASAIDDVIVSLDGPPHVHDCIRRVPGAFEKMASGVDAVHRIRREMPIRARCTVQKANHQALCASADAAKRIGLLSISFLAADLASTAFNRPAGWSEDRRNRIALTAFEIEALAAEVERLIRERSDELQSGFVVESPEKLRRIVAHFRAHLGEGTPQAPRCNAPWVSAVVDAGGDIRPCFFHRVLGNIHEQPLVEVLNSPQALQFRRELDVAHDPICRRCVCSLYIPRGESAQASG